jgi:hypothetical protein
MLARAGRRRLKLKEAMMRETRYQDREGRRWQVLLPEGVPDSEAEKGVRLGPPDLTPLDLPLSLEVRLNNELHARGMIRDRDVRGRRADVIGALMAALAVDAGRISDLYALTGAGPAP